MRNYTTFKEIVDRIVVENDYPATQSAKVLEIVLRGWRRCMRHMNRDVVTRFFAVEQNLRYITLPFDYEGYTKVGILVKNQFGQSVIMTLSRNDELCTEDMAPLGKALACDCEEPDTIAEAVDLIAHGHYYGDTIFYRNGYRSGQYVGEYYGLQGGMSALGAFRPREDQGRIYFSTDVPLTRQIALEYKSNGMTQGALTKIPYHLEEYLIAYGKYGSMNSRNSTQGEKREVKDDMLRLEAEVYDYILARTEDEWFDLLYGINNLT